MQGLAQASENPPAQEQWKTMKKTMRRTIGTVGILPDLHDRRT
jgi:hypothetical protein